MRSNASQFRAFSEERLRDEEVNTYRELLNLRFRLSTRQLANAGELSAAKRRLAQIKTVLRERELAGVQA
ncbi:MAG: 50S ribosomal protein L29 [Chloroflexi bacterium]|nr:50S ribosomal protein L29 [Chloroflexota bacterium]